MTNIHVSCWKGFTMTDEEEETRGELEHWLDKHNHKMELLRTVTSALAALPGVFIFLKVFDFI